jgi:cyanophycin synthetase
MDTSTQRRDLKISARTLYDELHRQNVLVTIIDAPSSLLMYLDKHGNEHLLFSTSSDKSAATGMVIANSKYRTSLIAKKLGIPVPEEQVCDEYKEVLNFFNAHKNIVTKPLGNSGGTGVTVNIPNRSRLKKAYLYARRYTPRVLVQQYISGTDIRLLVINGVFCSAVERRPAHIIGDGVTTIKDLIFKENKTSKRQASSMAAMDLIDVASSQRYLGEKLQTIPKKNTSVRVIGPANLSRGGTAHEATHRVTQPMIDDAEKISKKLKLGICGVDMMWNEETGDYYLIEVNSTPGVNMHNDPFWGTSSNAIEKYVQWLVA